MTKASNIPIENNIQVCPTQEQASITTAHLIADVIKSKQELGEFAVLGLATGNTPKLVYQELVQMHKNQGLSFKNVISFNLDEYHGITPAHRLSYHRFMRTYLFDHVDILPENIHLPFGTWELNKIEAHCAAYEAKINDYNGIDIQLLGIGRNGHIAFNEPGSSFDSVTRLINLHDLTRKDAANEFGGLELVPKQAVTMGIQTIMNAKRILLLALGERKAEIISKTFESEMTSEITATFLKARPDIEYIFDKEAASML